MSCFWRDKETYNVKEVIDLLGLPFGRNTLYKKLVERGLLDKDHIPNSEMIKQGLMTYKEQPIFKGKRLTVHYIPFFTKAGLRIVQKLINDSIKKNEQSTFNDRA